MKFTPESLIEIYLNGSFTEEAQAEFDRLMRKDPAFAEQVTKAVAERVGPAPDSLEKVSASLDSKMEGLWQSHRPSPYRQAIQGSLKWVLLLAAAGGIYGGLKYFGTSLHPVTGTPAGQLPEGNPATAGSSASRGERNAVSKKPVQGGSRVPVLSLGPNRASASADSNYPASSALKTSENKQAPGPSASGGDRQEETNRVRTSSAATKPQPSTGTVPQTEEGYPLRISIETEKTQKVAVSVLDSNGFLVRHLYQGLWNAGEHMVDWDGKDETGNAVLPGNYTVVVAADGKTLSGTLTVQPGR